MELTKAEGNCPPLSALRGRRSCANPNRLPPQATASLNLKTCFDRDLWFGNLGFTKNRHGGESRASSKISKSRSPETKQNQSHYVDRILWSRGTTQKATQAPISKIAGSPE
jgi:hypothetical protein